MIIQERLQKLISMTEETCVQWLINNENGQIEFVDPIDKVEISAHYGATHMAAALLLCDREQLGNELLKSVLERWASNSLLTGFHNDFNNFALCIICDLVNEDQRNKIKQIVLRTPDSNHDTVNWLPMRWAVNRSRYNWTNDKKYLAVCETCKKKIADATWTDGFIDDRLPVGLSFNLQYDVATVAVIQYLRICGEEVDISKELGALLAAEAPDGDINYLGRGTNQIFAWGLWVYLLASSGQQVALNHAIAYLEKYLPTALKNNNLMLNGIPGQEKYMWWDYHYCSVYTAHLLMWLILAQKHMGKAAIVPESYHMGNSGVKIFRNDFAFAVTFEGRKEYLAERGPALYALWTRNQGMLIKGTFGPWQGAFGNKHMEFDTTLRNFAGNLVIRTNKDYSKKRLLNKLSLNSKVVCYESVAPQFYDVSVLLTEEAIEIRYANPKSENIIFNFPTMVDKIKYEKVFLMVDEIKCELVNNQMLKNQYGWCKLFCSKEICGKQIKLRIER